MGLRNIFIHLLITGLLSFCVAQEQNTFKQHVCRSLLQSGNIDQFAIFGCAPIVAGVIPVEEFLRAKCGINGSPLSYDNAKRSLGFFSDCFTAVIDTRRIAIDFQSNGPRRNIYQQYCRRLPVLQECFRYTTDSVEPCLEDGEERKSAETVFNVMNTFFKFICYEDGERLLGLEERSSLECISSNADAIRRCANESFNSYVPKTDFDASRTERLGRLATPLIPSAEDCTNLDNFQNCTVQLLAQCENKQPADLLNSVLNSIKVETPCENLLEMEGLTPLGNLLADNGTEIFNSTIWSEIDNSTIWSEIDNSSSTIASEINPEFSNQSIAEFLVDNCRKNGGPRAFNVAIKVPQDFEDCVKGVVDMKQVEAELQAALPIGEVSRVFAKYCRRVPNLNKCVRKAIKSIKPCMEPEVQNKIDVINNVTRAVLRFACHSHGERLEEFMLSGAPHCMENKKGRLENCATQAFGGYNQAGGIGGFGRFQALLNLATEDCDKMKEYKRCVVRTFQECEDTSAASMLDSLMRSVIKATPCRDSLRR